jgi:ketopantoate hydroxymethyltransferase
MGGFRVQGKNEGAAPAILDDAPALDQAGAYAIALEGESARREPLASAPAEDDA